MDSALLAAHAQRLAGKMLRVLSSMTLSHEMYEAYAAGVATTAWMQQVQQSAAGWLAQLPESVPALQVAPDSADALRRCFAREAAFGSALLATIRSDLTDVIAMCEGKMKQTNHLVCVCVCVCV